VSKVFLSPRRVLASVCPSIILVMIILLSALASSAFGARLAYVKAAPPKVSPAKLASIKAAATQSSQGTGSQTPRIWLAEPQGLQVTHVPAAGVQNLLAPAGPDFVASQPQPLSMINGDFDGDGIEDLAVGYATPGGGAIVLHRGNLDAYAPQSHESWLAIGQGRFPQPFLAEAQVINVPIRPDFIAVGKFGGNSGLDLAVASRNGNTLYILAGDGQGNFAAPQGFSLSGGITTLAAGRLGNQPDSLRLLVGVRQQKASSLWVLSESAVGFRVLGSYPLDAPVTSIAFGDFGDLGPDAAILAGGRVSLLHSSSMQLETLSLPVSASAMTLGWFIFDRNPDTQIALLTSDGSIQIVAHNEFDPRPRTNDEMRTIRQAVLSGEPNPLVPRRSVATNGWRVVESIPSVAPFSPGQPPVLVTTRISIHGADDVMALNPSMGQLAVAFHPDPVPGETTFHPAQVSTRPFVGSPVAAVTTRVNVDGRPGVVALHDGQVSPMVMMPLPDPTFFPNRFDDITPRGTGVTCLNTGGVDGSGDCTLREAILKANGDTVMLQAGTYTLSIAKVANDCTGNFGALSVDRNLTLVGAGQNSTFIQAGTTAYNAGTPNGVDMVMNVNEDLATGSCPVTNASASISNLTIQNGHNRGTHGNDGDGGCMEFDTGTSGTATLSLTNVTLQNCDTTQGNGGGLAVFNFVVNGPGMPTITNSIIQGNKGVDSVGGGSSGGGIFVSDPSRILMTGSQVINNSVPTGVGLGGGLRIFSNVSGSRQTVIHSSTISGNSANGSGGGIWASSNLMVDQGTIFSGNSAGIGNIANSKDGGGLFLNTKNPDSVTLSKVTIAGNTTTGNGGGISDGNLSGGFGTLSLQFSRLAGNTSTLGSNLNNIDGTVTATNDWWGTNTPASTINNTTTTATFDPFIVLTHTASPNKIRINQSTTLTADMSKDNHGSGVALAGNLNQIIGLPITFNNAVDGSISGAQTAIQNNGMATATFNAGNVAGGGKADAVVDQATVTANIIVLQPPSIAKSFSPTVIKVNGTSTITFSITNPNVVTINASFTDDLTSGGTVSGLVVASTPSVVNGCGGSVTANAGATSISFLNAALPVSASPCTITVNVTGTSDGIKPNSVTIDSTDAGNGNTATASPSLTVINPPTINKVFGASAIPLNGSTSLTFTITNPNSNAVSVLNGISFTDTLPNAAPGTLVVATPNGLTNTCSTTPTATAGSGTVSLTGASLAAGASCTISVNVKGTVAGLAPNSVTVSDTIAGTGNTSSTSLTVVAPPTINKSFNPTSVPLNTDSTLTFTITNPNTSAVGDLTGVAFSDSLPVSGGPGSATLVVSGTPSVTNTCGGTVTATAGTGVISLSGASVAHNASCTLSVNVTGTVAGDGNNTTGAITSTEGGTGTTSNTATLKVVAPPSIAKAFNPTSTQLNNTSLLTFTITNPAANTVAETGVAFTDTLPTGLTVARRSRTCSSVP